MRRAFALLSLTWCLACAETPERLVSEHREEIAARLQAISDLQKELGNQPHEAVKVEALARNNLQLVPAEELASLSPSAPYLGSRPHRSGRPDASNTLTYFAAKLQSTSKLQGPSWLLEDVKVHLELLRALRFVGVVSTREWRPTGTKPARWAGQVAVWDLQEKKWVSVVPVELDDTPITETGVVIAYSNGRRESADEKPTDRDYSFTGALYLALLDAVRAGAPFKATKNGVSWVAQ